MNYNIKKILRENKQKKIFGFFVLLFIFLILFYKVPIAFGETSATQLNLTSSAVSQGIGWAVQVVIGSIAYIVTAVTGLIITMLVDVLVNVAQYSDFINSPVVLKGWVIIRDLCNMFFVLAMLVIAFATILKIENYSAKRLLPKLLVMAVVINFSKMIFGLMIDFSQVVMLTFVNAFDNGGWFIGMFRVDHFLNINDVGSLTKATEGNVSTWGTVVAIIAGMFASIMTVVIISVVLAVLVMRIIMLWIYTMLSPLVFLGFAFPPVQSYTSRIWSDFTKQLVVGPILALFIWLAMSLASDTSIPATISSENSICVGASQIFCSGEFQKFIMVIGLLMGGLMVAQQAGGVISKAAGKAEGWAKGGMKLGTKGMWKGTKAVGGQAHALASQFESYKNVANGFSQLKSKSGWATGAATGAITGAALGPVGSLIGMAAGGLVGGFSFKKLSDTMDSGRKRKQRLYDASQKPDKSARLDENGKATEDESKVAIEWSDKKGLYEYTKDVGDNKKGQIYRDEKGHIVGRWGDVEDKGKKYRRIDTAGNYGEIDSEGSYLTYEGKKISDGASAQKAKFKAMTDGEAKRWAGYSSVKYKGWGAKDAVVDEKIDKIAGEYKGQSNELLRQLLDLEKNSTKKMGISLALGLKKGFSDGAKGIKEVMKAKENLSGNGLLMKKFNDAMNKNHMVLNNSKIETVDGKDKVVLDEGSIAKLVSSSGANWKDQAWATHNEQSLKLMSKQLGVGFEKEFTASMKTDKDRDTAKKTISKFVEELDFKPPESSIRKAFATSTGEFIKAYSDKNGLDEDKLGEMISGIKKASTFADVDKEVRKNEDFQRIFAKNSSVNMMVKISGSHDMDKTTMEQYAWMVKEHNPDLYDKMKQDKKLAALMDDVKNKDKFEDIG